MPVQSILSYMRQGDLFHLSLHEGLDGIPQRPAGSFDSFVVQFPCFFRACLSNMTMHDVPSGSQALKVLSFGIVCAADVDSVLMEREEA